MFFIDKYGDGCATKWPTVHNNWPEQTTLFIEELLNKSPRPLYLMCIAHNGPMYEKFGFRIIEHKDMPRYFQRIKKLFDVTDVFRQSSEELLVMKLE